MDNERQNEKPQVEGGISLFKILVIVLLVMIVGLLIYMYRIEYSKYDDIDANPTEIENTDNGNFYYKGIPDVVEDDAINDEKDSDILFGGNYSSTPKSFEYKPETVDVDENQKKAHEEQKKKIEEFNTTRRGNIVLSNIYSDSENRLAYTYELTNNNSVPEANITMQVVFYDETGKAIANDEVYFEYIPAKSTAYEIGELNNIKYSRYDFIINESFHREVEECDKGKLEYEIRDEKYSESYFAYGKNNSPDDLKALFRATYKDETGKIIRVEDRGMYLDVNPDGEYIPSETFPKYVFGQNEYREDPVPYKTCDIEFISAYRFSDYDVVPSEFMY